MTISKGRPGPPTKERTAKSLSITLNPELYDKIEIYISKNMSELHRKGLYFRDGEVNRSGVIALLLNQALDC